MQKILRLLQLNLFEKRDLSYSHLILSFETVHRPFNATEYICYPAVCPFEIDPRPALPSLAFSWRDITLCFSIDAGWSHKD